MKASITETKGIFKPFTISIEVNNETELFNLWHRFNIGVSQIEIEESLRADNSVSIDYVDVSKVWRALDERVNELLGI
jgi:hypothetical protein